MAFRVLVRGFQEGETIPARHTCDGENVSPAVEWFDEPAGTKGFALIVDDPDAPRGTWNHWLLWDLPTGVHSLEEKFRPGMMGRSGNNDFGQAGYGGPCPPRGHGPHRYFFRLYALRTESLGLTTGATRAEVDRALKGQVLGDARMMGRYERK
jgi:Raf kinase inhibitor-like YbhB/YbcL family protein